jgi:hypothetical protein
VAKSVTVKNNDNTALNFSGVSFGGTNPGDFAETATTCAATVAAHGSCTISVVFSPVAPGTRSATLMVTDSATNSPQSLALSGTGVVPVTLAPSSLTYAIQKVGTTSASKTVTVKNNLPVALSFTGVSFTGANPGDFLQTGGTCGASLASRATCTITVAFQPSAAGSRTAVLSVADDASTSPQTVNLSGTGK